MEASGGLTMEDIGIDPDIGMVHGDIHIAAGFPMVLEIIRTVDTVDTVGMVVTTGNSAFQETCGRHMLQISPGWFY
jgi:hypothetical protein